MDPRIIGTVLNVAALLGMLALTAWLGLRIVRGQNRWPKLLLPILAIVFTFAALGSADSERQVEVDR